MIIPGTPLPGPHICLPSFLGEQGYNDIYFRGTGNKIGEQGTYCNFGEQEKKQRETREQVTHTLGEIKLQMQQTLTLSMRDILMYYNLLSNSNLHDSSDIEALLKEQYSDPDQLVS